MVTGGSEMATTPLGVSGFLASRALSKSDDPKQLVDRGTKIVMVLYCQMEPQF